jgi:D-ribose pyranase
MKKIGIINQPISALIAGLGHTDKIVIADAGLPIPLGVPRIDLALNQGLPSFIDVLEAVLQEMLVEKAIIATEISMYNPKIESSIYILLNDIPIENISHEEFKNQTRSARAVIRTGEFTPYANIILFSGVVF